MKRINRKILFNLIKNVGEQIHDNQKVIKRLEEKLIGFFKDHEEKKKFSVQVSAVNNLEQKSEEK